MQTADQIMTQLGFGEREDGDFEDRRDIFVKHVSHRLTAQRTGGADWAARYVWAVPNGKAEKLGLPVRKSATIYLVWNEGDAREPIVFVQRFDDEDRYDDEPEEIRETSWQDALQLVGRR